MAATSSVGVSEPGNDIILLERVFLRLGNTDTDQQLETCVGKFLPPVLLKLASPHEQVRTKVMELLVHINKRVRCRPQVQLPLPALLSMYKDEKATSFVINFTIIYITMGFPRLPKEQQLELMPDLFASIASRPQSHQDDILLLVMPILGDLGNKTPLLDLKNRTQQAKILLRLSLDLLLLPYGALPGTKEAGSEFPVPPGLSPQSYKKLTEKNTLDASQLELIKQSIVKFLNNDAVNDSDTLLPLIVAAADSRFSVANIANSALGRVASSVDWSNVSVVSPLYSLFLGGQQQRVPACTRIRLKLLHYLNRATGAAILYPHSIQVVFTSLFAQNTNPRLKTLALNFTMNMIQNGDIEQLKKVSPVILGGLLKLTNVEEEWAHHAQAFTCIGRLVSKCPNAVSKRYELLEELFNKMPGSPPELRLAIREALLAMSGSFTVDPTLDSKKSEPMDVEVSGESSMEVDESSDDKAKQKDTKEHGTHISELLEKHLDSEDAMVRFVATRYASVLFPDTSVVSKYLLLLGSGDSKEEVKVEALKALYGTARHNEIEDVVQNIENTNISHKGTPTFIDMVQYIWMSISKRKEGTNPKHRFVVGNHVLPFTPNAYYEMLRYLRTCLNRDAGIKDGVPHPSVSSPILGTYLTKIFEDSPQSVNNYLSMVKILLAACPDIVPLTCLLDIIGCVPSKISSQYVDQLTFFSNQLINTTREEVRDTSAMLYAIVKAHTSDIKSIETDVSDMISKCKSVKSLESQCGYMIAFSALLERTITLIKYKMSSTLSGDFDIMLWPVYKEGVLLIGECLSNSQSLIVSYACQCLSMLSKCYALPIPEKEDKTSETISENKDSKILTKHSIVENLFSLLKSAKYSSKIKERATKALGDVCVGEHFSFAKEIIQGFLDMAKETKDFEIHLEIGEALVLCVDGVNSIQNRDLWSQPPPSASHPTDNKALTENDVLLDWLLTELLNFVSFPHPNSRQASCVWLLTLVKNCSERKPIKNKWASIQEAFMEYLSENNEIVQDVASKGLSLVYQGCGEGERRGLVERLLEQLAGGSRKVQQVTHDTKIFEDGQLGKTPQGGNISTYKELCSLASDLNQPDLIYKFMHLANHNSVWNSKKGAAFGFQYIMQQAGAQLSDHLPKIIPRLYRYRFDPTPKIQNSMSSIWHALVPETQKTVEKYHVEILNDLVNNLTSNQWRVRTSCCLGLSDLLRTSRSLWEFLPRLEEIWTQLFRVMDDVHEGTRTAANNTTSLLAKMCITATDGQHPGKLGKEILTIMLPILMDHGITNTVAEIRQLSLQTVSKLVSSNGSSLKPFMAQLVPGLLRAAGELESSKLSYMSAALGGQQTQEAVDSVRAHAAKSHYTTETVTKCIQYIDVECLGQMLPQILETLKTPQLGSKVAVAHCLGLLGLQLGKDMQPLAGKMLSALLNTLLDRNPTVRKQCADTIGIIVGTAKESSVDKLMQKLCTWYKERDEDSVRSAIALTLYACSNRHAELLKDRSSIVMPTLFFAMHADKTPDTKSTVELFEEIWSDISPSKELGIRKNLQSICDCLKEGISSPSWSTKAQAARGIEMVANEIKSGFDEERIQLLNILLEGLKGRSWQGKEALVNSVAQLCRVNDGGEKIPEALVQNILESVMRECSKQEPLYKIKCLSALGCILNELKIDKFQEVYNILHETLAKSVGAVEKDSDDEEFSNEQSLKKKEQLISLKEVAYETLGKAWPDNIETQGKYQRVFAEHCSNHMGMSTRTVQVAIVTALLYYVEKLILLNQAPENSNKDDLSFIIDNLIQVLDHSFSIQKHTRLRKEALNILSVVGKKLKESKNDEAFSKLKDLYVKYESELSSDVAPEIRSRLVQIKGIFQ